VAGGGAYNRAGGAAVLTGEIKKERRKDVK
jgi:hypothetical protein